MRFKYTCSINAIPYEPGDYVNEGTVDVLVDDHILGRLSLDYIDTGRVLDDGREDLIDVCDSDSQGWYNVYAALYDQETGDLAEEIGCDDTFDFLLLLYKMRLHPAILHLEPFILSQVARIRGGASIFTMLDSVPSIPVKELANIGFAKVANSELYFFPCMYASVVPAVDDNLIPELDPTVDYTAELLTQWDKT